MNKFYKKAKISKIVKKIALIFLFALLLRLAFVLVYPQLPIEADAGSYVDLATNIFEGNGYAQNGIEETRRAPGYPFFLALIFFAFGKSLVFVRIIQAIISSLTVVLIYQLAKDLFNKRIAFFSVILAALYPPFIFYSGTILTETIYTFLIVVAFYLLNKKFNKKNSILFGTFFGFAALMRTESILIVFFTLFALFLSSKQKKKIIINGTIISLAMFLVITPWSIRNYTLYDQFFLINTQYGIDLAMATYPEYSRGETTYTPEIFIEDKNPTPVELADIYSEQAKEYLIENPLFYLKRSFVKFFKFWIGSHTVALQGFVESFGNTLQNGNYFVFFIKAVLLLFNTILVILGLLGLKKFVKDQRIKGFNRALFVSPIIAKVLIHSVFIGFVRFQIPIMPFVLVLVSYFLTGKK